MNRKMFITKMCSSMLIMAFMLSGCSSDSDPVVSCVKHFCSVGYSGRLCPSYGHLLFRYDHANYTDDQVLAAYKKTVGIIQAYCEGALKTENGKKDKLVFHEREISPEDGNDEACVMMRRVTVVSSSSFRGETAVSVTVRITKPEKKVANKKYVGGYKVISGCPHSEIVVRFWDD